MIRKETPDDDLSANIGHLTFDAAVYRLDFADQAATIQKVKPKYCLCGKNGLSAGLFRLPLNDAIRVLLEEVDRTW